MESSSNLICEVLKTRPTTYKLIDESGEIIKGSFYPEELQKTKTDGVYLVEKLLETRTKKGKKEYLVKYMGYPDQYNTLEPEKNIAHQLKDKDRCMGVLVTFKIVENKLVI